MSKPLYIDVATGLVRASLTGPVASRIKFFLRDVIPLRVAFVENGVNVTSDVLETAELMPASLKIGIRAKPGEGSILALATIYTVVDGEARITLNLNTEDLVTYMTNEVPASEREAELTLEIEVSSNTDSKIVTYYQAPCVIGKEVNVSDDDPPIPAAEADDYVKRSELAGYAGATVLDELLDVEVPAPENHEHLIFDSLTSRWKGNRILDGGNF